MKKEHYDYINKVQERALKDPNWFWNTDEGTTARQWLYDNGATSIVENIYNYTPENIQKTIDSKKLPHSVSKQRLVSDIHSAQNKFLDTAGAIGLQSAGTVGLAIGAATAPEVTLPAIIGGLAGGKATDKIIEKKSKGKYTSWGTMLRGNKDWGQTGNILSEFTNPGFIVGGGIATGAVNRTTPMVIRQMQNQIYDSKINLPSIVRYNADQPIKWRWAKDASYDNGTIRTPLFARKSQIAHELGHHAAGTGDQILGAYTPGYEYSPTASWETNRAENFADAFKTQLGYRYKGRNPNLKVRQKAIDEGETNIFRNLTNPGNHRETASDFLAIEDPTSHIYGIRKYLDNLAYDDPYTREPNNLVIVNESASGVPDYSFEINPNWRPLDEDFEWTAVELTDHFGNKVDFRDLSLENLKAIQNTINSDPYIKKFQGVVDYKGEPIFKMPFDIRHMFWDNPNKNGAKSLMHLIKRPDKGGVRITETNTSPDSEVIKAFIGDMFNGTNKGQVTVIPAKRYWNGKLYQDRGVGNRMDGKTLTYENGEYIWDLGSGKRRWQAPLNEESYNTAAKNYVDQVLGKLNIYIEGINKKQKLNLRPAQFETFPSFEEFNSTREIPNDIPIVRDNFFLQFHKNGGTIKPKSLTSK